MLFCADSDRELDMEARSFIFMLLDCAVFV
jgi:hypothetical protein